MVDYTDLLAFGFPNKLGIFPKFAKNSFIIE